ncbi:uncharacterized protein [Antedon mediterranea]|uniref:uncharacterized protein isoform X2 n=1 Tax=Antedon mediterranea TaxID=105859 RepID=UPI003AF73884
MALSYCTIIFIFIQSSIIIVNSSPVVQIKVKRSNICDNVKCLPGYQCCEEGRDACGGNECEQCIDGTFSSGEVGGICQNCHHCLHGENKIEECTREKDTVCECPYGKYITSSRVCLSCEKCGEEDCKKVCNVTTTPKPPARTTTQKTTIPAETTEHPTDPEKKSSPWKNIYLLPILLFLLIIGIIVLCCKFNEKFRKFLENLFPGYSFGIIHKKFAEGDNKIQDEKSDITLVNMAGGEDSVPSDEKKSQETMSASCKNDVDKPKAIEEQEPLMKSDDVFVKKGSGNLGKSAALKKRFPRRRSSTSSLPDVPENRQLSVVLRKWCYQDRARVEPEHVSEISKHIGKEVARIGFMLGLTNGEVETIEHNHKSDLSRQNLVVLQIWLEKRGVSATKSVLARALNSIGRPELALKHLWTDQEWKQGMQAVNKESTFWKRRKSRELVIKLDSDYFDGKDWEMQSTWQGIWEIMLENDFGNFRQLKLACGAVELQQPPLEGAESCPYFKGNLCLDQNAEQLIDSEFIHLKPVCVSDGVNCLFSAASVIYYGSEDNFLELKLRTVIELAYHKDHYMRQKALIKCIKAEYALTKLEENDVLTKPKDVEANFENSIRQTLSEQNLFSLQGNSIQLFGLASVLNCNIQSVFPTMGASETSPLNVLITPRKEQENPATVFIMWSRHTPLPEDGQFVPNHFVPLLQEPPTIN